MFNCDAVYCCDFSIILNIIPTYEKQVQNTTSPLSDFFVLLSTSSRNVAFSIFISTVYFPIIDRIKFRTFSGFNQSVFIIVAALETNVKIPTYTELFIIFPFNPFLFYFSRIFFQINFNADDLGHKTPTGRNHPLEAAFEFRYTRKCAFKHGLIEIICDKIKIQCSFGNTNSMRLIAKIIFKDCTSNNI